MKRTFQGKKWKRIASANIYSTLSSTQTTTNEYTKATFFLWFFTKMVIPTVDEKLGTSCSTNKDVNERQLFWSEIWHPKIKVIKPLIAQFLLIVPIQNNSQIKSEYLGRRPRQQYFLTPQGTRKQPDLGATVLDRQCQGKTFINCEVSKSEPHLISENTETHTYIQDWNYAQVLIFISRKWDYRQGIHMWL